MRPIFTRTVIIFVLFSLAFAPLLALADSQPETHLALVDTTNDHQRAQLRSTGVTVIEDYGSFAMVRGTDEQLSVFDVRRDLDGSSSIGMAGKYYDTSRPVEAQLPDDLVSEAPEGTGYYIVHFMGPVKEAWKDELRSIGAEPMNYVPEYAFITRMDAASVSAVRALPFVTYVGLYQPAFKIQSAVLQNVGTLDINIVLFEGEPTGPVVRDLMTMGAYIVEVVPSVNPTIEAIILDTDVPTVARMTPVLSIVMRYKGGLPPNDPAQWISQSNVQNYYPLYDHGLHGENMTIGNADTGIHVDHLAFKDPARNVQYSDPAGNTPPDTQHRKIVNYWTFADNIDEYGHGTMTVGVNVGDNDPNAGNPQYHGMAYKAKVSFQDVWDDGGGGDQRPADKGKMYEKSWKDGAWVHSGSLVCAPGGAYNDDAMELDQFLWNHKDFLGVIANHNYGSGDVANSVCDMASAKDTMSMGAAYNDPNQNGLWDYTGRGPTDDGRLKPTIAATTDINCPRDNTQNGFDNLGGTSGATPDAAGNMILARQYFYEGFYPSGEKSPSDGFNASGALLKAIGVNSAEEMTGDNAYMLPYSGMSYPSNTQGWGRLNLDNALYFTGDAKGLIIDDNRTGLSTGETAEYAVNVVSSTDPLEVTLVWTDYWGTIAAPKEIVNDLDLQVTAPDGTTVYKGNVLGGAAFPHQSVTGGNYDNLNVEENVLNLTPTMGTWNVKVTATNTPQGPQEYALVITGNLSRANDLAVYAKDIKFSKMDPVEGDNLTVNFTVKNLGGNPIAAADIDVLLDGNDLASKTLPIVGGAVRFEILWQTTWGDHTFKVIVDPLDLIVEARETNNVAERKIYVNKMPTAAFEATPTTIYSFENVTVDASASSDDGSVAKYQIDWGDGSVQTWVYVPTSIHQYKTVGTYNVTLKVQDNTSLETPWTPPVVITVLNRLPWVNATATDHVAYTLYNISFDGSKSGDREGAVTLHWDFDDGNVSDVAKPMHWFADDGFYNVTLTVTDKHGATNTTTVKLEILNRAPTAIFSVSDYEGNATTQFNFVPVVSDQDGTVPTFIWDFGDGNTSDKEAPIHHYGDDGTYNVTLVVADDDGAKSVLVNRIITIYNLAPTANFTVTSPELLTFENFTFISTSSDIDGSVVNMTWNMGDGSFYYGTQVVHSYREDKTYKVNLKILDDDDAGAEWNMTVTVKNRPPVAGADWNRTSISGGLVLFSAKNSTDKDGFIVSYIWDFGNGTVKREADVNYTFWAAGTYYVNLTVTDNDMAKDTIELSITVAPPPPPPKKPKPNGLSMVAIYALVGLVIAIVVIVVLVLVMKGMKGKAQQAPPQPVYQPQAQPAPPTGFDPNASAQAPPPTDGGAVQEYDEFGLPLNK